MAATTGQTAELWQVNKYLWLCLLYIALYLSYLHALGVIPNPAVYTFGILALAILNGGLRTYSGWKRGGNQGPIAWTFTVVDIALLSVGIYLTGGIRSELGAVYLVLLISESLYTSPRQTGILIGLMAVGYLAATWSSHTEPGYWAAVITRVFFLLMLGMLARRISGNREQRARELMRLREQVAETDERARIAREIHDGLGHALVASILRLDLCSRLIRKDPDEAERLLQSEVPALRAAWNEGRDMAFHLRPWERDGRGFIDTLRRHIGRFAERTGISVDLDAEDESWELPPDVEMTTTRIIQEALTNVAKHSRATQATVCVDYEFGRLRCTIKDDGVGFEADPASGSFGLYAMKDRAERAGGTLTVNSRPGEGTTIELLIPA